MSRVIKATTAKQPKAAPMPKEKARPVLKTPKSAPQKTADQFLTKQRKTGL
jgi:hypothetical protein